MSTSQTLLQQNTTVGGEGVKWKLKGQGFQLKSPRARVTQLPTVHSKSVVGRARICEGWKLTGNQPSAISQLKACFF
jgi:hypothetical protein